jgi:hypothetical protein
VLSATVDIEPTQRDGHIQAIAGKGRMAWQRDSGYNERARVEGQFARWKQVIGDGLRFHSDEARATEVAIAAQIARPWTPELRPHRLISSGEGGLPCPFLLRATRCHATQLCGHWATKWCDSGNILALVRFDHLTRSLLPGKWPLA